MRKNVSNFGLKLVTAPVQRKQYLKERGYVLVNVVGLCGEDSSLFDGINRIRGICTTQYMHLHKEAGDYMACNILFKDKISSFDKSKLLTELTKLKTETNKIAFVGNENDLGFCFRHIFADYLLNELGVGVSEVGVSDYDLFLAEKSKLWLKDSYKNTGIDLLSDAELEKLLEDNKWTYAKSMPQHPHWYTIRKTWSSDKLFTKAYLNIREKGEQVIAFGRVFREFKGKEYKYWTMPCGFHNRTKIADNIILINKAKI